MRGRFCRRAGRSSPSAAGACFRPPRARAEGRKSYQNLCVCALPLCRGGGGGGGAAGVGIVPRTWLCRPKPAAPPPPPVGVVGGRGVVGGCHPSSPRLSAPRCPSLGRWGAAQVAGGRMVPFVRGRYCRRAARSSRSTVGACSRPSRARAEGCPVCPNLGLCLSRWVGTSAVKDWGEKKLTGWRCL